MKQLYKPLSGTSLFKRITWWLTSLPCLKKHYRFLCFNLVIFLQTEPPAEIFRHTLLTPVYPLWQWVNGK